jgi:hypothetical protein
MLVKNGEDYGVLQRFCQREADWVGNDGGGAGICSKK